MAPQVGTFPLLEVPTGSHDRNLGGEQLQTFLPLWLQKSIGPWTAYGRGGYRINPGAHNQNWWFTGIVVHDAQSAVCGRLYRILPTLPDGYGQIICLVNLLGESRGVVAKTMGITLNNLDVRLHRTRRSLRDLSYAWLSERCLSSDLCWPGASTNGDDNCAACHAPGAGVTRTKCVACHADDTELLLRQLRCSMPISANARRATASIKTGMQRPTRMDHAAPSKNRPSRTCQG